jgi:hypothetical protein
MATTTALGFNTDCPKMRFLPMMAFFKTPIKIHASDKLYGKEPIAENGASQFP